MPSTLQTRERSKTQTGLAALAAAATAVGALAGAVASGHVVTTAALLSKSGNGGGGSAVIPSVLVVTIGGIAVPILSLNLNWPGSFGDMVPCPASMDVPNTGADSPAIIVFSNAGTTPINVTNVGDLNGQTEDVFPWPESYSLGSSRSFVHTSNSGFADPPNPPASPNGYLIWFVDFDGVNRYWIKQNVA